LPCIAVKRSAKKESATRRRAGTVSFWHTSTNAEYVMDSWRRLWCSSRMWVIDLCVAEEEICCSEKSFLEFVMVVSVRSSSIEFNWVLRIVVVSSVGSVREVVRNESSCCTRFSSRLSMARAIDQCCWRKFQERCGILAKKS